MEWLQEHFELISWLTTNSLSDDRMRIKFGEFGQFGADMIQLRGEERCTFSLFELLLLFTQFVMVM